MLSVGQNEDAWGKLTTMAGPDAKDDRYRKFVTVWHRMSGFFLALFHVIDHENVTLFSVSTRDKCCGE